MLTVFKKVASKKVKPSHAQSFLPVPEATKSMVKSSFKGSFHTSGSFAQPGQGLLMEQEEEDEDIVDLIKLNDYLQFLGEANE